MVVLQVVVLVVVELFCKSKVSLRSVSVGHKSKVKNKPLLITHYSLLPVRPFEIELEKRSIPKGIFPIGRK